LAAGSLPTPGFPPSDCPKTVPSCPSSPLSCTASWPALPSVKDAQPRTSSGRMLAPAPAWAARQSTSALEDLNANLLKAASSVPQQLEPAAHPSAHSWPALPAAAVSGAPLKQPGPMLVPMWPAHVQGPRLVSAGTGTAKGESHQLAPAPMAGCEKNLLTVNAACSSSQPRTSPAEGAEMRSRMAQVSACPCSSSVQGASTMAGNRYAQWNSPDIITVRDFRAGCWGRWPTPIEPINPRDTGGQA